MFKVGDTVRRKSDGPLGLIGTVIEVNKQGAWVLWENPELRQFYSIDVDKYIKPCSKQLDLFKDWNQG